VAFVYLFSLTTTVPQVVLCRGLLGVVATAFWVTASTLTADISPPEVLTQSVGRYNMSCIAGFIVGPFLGGLISDNYGFPALFMTLSAIVVSSVVVIWTKLSKLRLKSQAERRGLNIKAVMGLSSAYLTLFPFTIVLGIYMAIIPGHMRGLGVIGSAIGLLLTMTNGVRGIGFFNAERLVKWGTRRSVGMAAFLLRGAFFLVASSKRALDFILPLAMYGLAAGILTPVTLDYIAHRTPREALGTAMGMHEGIYGIGMSIGPMAGGAIAKAYRPSTLYLILAGMSLIIVPLSYTLRKSPPEPIR
jgi:DHA1 family multidrug resistance protein-like MFS transporter